MSLHMICARQGTIQCIPWEVMINGTIVLVISMSDDEACPVIN